MWERPSGRLLERAPQVPPDQQARLVSRAQQEQVVMATPENRPTKSPLSTAIQALKWNGWYRLSGLRGRLARKAFRALRVRQDQPAGRAQMASRDRPALLALRAYKAARVQRDLRVQRGRQARDLSAHQGQPDRPDPLE